MTALLMAVLLSFPARGASAPAPGNRVASILVSQSLVNEILKQFARSNVMRDVSLEFDADSGSVVAHGIAHVPLEELKAVNVDPSLGDFRFHVTVRLKTTPKGHLIVVFPLEETFFYPADSDDPKRDRVIVPVQLLSLALASARGYLAALSGDFTAFDRYARRLRLRVEDADRELALTKDPNEREALENERKTAKLQLEAMPLERKQLEAMGKDLEGLLGFASAKEIDLNQEFAAKRNALILRLNLAQLAPYLTGVQLEGVRLLKDPRGGGGERFLAIDLDAQLAKAVAPAPPSPPHPHPPGPPPKIILRLNQALFESAFVLAAESRAAGDRLRRLEFEFTEDGIKIKGRWHLKLLPDIPFKAVIEASSPAANEIELRLREVAVAHVDLEVLSPLVLRAFAKRLNAALGGAVTFTEKDGSAHGVVDMHKLLPSFPDLAVTGVIVKQGELLLKAGSR